MLSDYELTRMFSKKHVVVGFLSSLILLIPVTAAQAGRLTSSEGRPCSGP
jgi:hypothetical protein